MDRTTFRSAFPLEVGVVLVIALLFRIAFLFHHHADGLQLRFDPSLYLALSDGLKSWAFSMFHPLDIPETTRMPGYPFLIYMLGSVPLVLVFQVIVSSLKIPLAYLLGKEMGLHGRLVLLPMLLMAIEPMDVILSGEVLTETIFTTLLFAGILFIIRSRRMSDVIVAALLFATAAYVRPNGVHVAILAALFLFIRGRSYMMKASLFMLLVFVLLLPWVIRNHSIDGRVHLSDSGVVVAAHFHVPDVLAMAGDPEAEHFRDQLTGHASSMDWTDRDQMRSYFKTIEGDVAGTFIAHPFAWVATQLKKSAIIFLAPGSGYINRHFGDLSIFAFALMLYSSLFSILLCAIVIALLFQIPRLSWMQWSLIGIIAFLILSAGISAPDSRFKNPAMPLALLLGSWVWEGWSWKAKRGSDRINQGNVPVSPFS